MSLVPRGLRPYILISAGLALYLLLAPAVHDRYVARAAVAMVVSGTQPSRDASALAQVDVVELSDAGRGIYLLIGWAFLPADPQIPAAAYERRLVLTSSSNTHVFSAATNERPDVQKYFAARGLSMDLRLSGLVSYINRYALAQDVYAVGVELTRSQTGEKSYASTGRCVQRTPNRLVLLEREDPVCTALVYGGMSKPAEVGSPLPGIAGAYEVDIEGLDSHRKGSTLYRMDGWAFIVADPALPAASYRHKLVLFSPAMSYIFSADTTLRPDIQERFPGLNLDLTMSGFTAYIDSSAIESGTYAVGVILEPTDGSEQALAVSTWCLRARSGKLRLVGVDVGKCAFR